MSDFLDEFKSSLMRAAEYNKHDQAGPTVVLWPDKERQWETLIPRIRAEVPLLTLGPYDPSASSGPAIWLRCMIARVLPEADWEEGTVPILYLPGVSKQELRAVEECPRHLQPLAELQYRGVLFTQRNGRDWTIAAFLQSADGGLQIPVGSDMATREAMQRALLKIADEPVSALRADAPLTAAKFNALLNPEPIRDVLLWMNEPAVRKASYGAPEWASFRAICRDQFGFDPETDGEVTAATLLGKREGLWGTAWNRFAEAPSKYANLPGLLRRARPANADDLFFQPSSWPQDNEKEEAALREALLTLDSLSSMEARETVLQLEAAHGHRRSWVWAELGLAPLAGTLSHLVILANASDKPLGGSTPHDIGTAYADGGWQTDRAALRALAAPATLEDVAAIKVAVDSLYRPWMRSTAEAFQQAVQNRPLQQGHEPGGGVPSPKPGRCILFADGLRLDVARGLSECLQSQGASVAVAWSFSALPGVTATAKPAVSPVAPLLGPSGEFGTAVISDGAKVTSEILRRELEKAGYQVLLGSETGNPAGGAWTECGHLDSYGHEQGWRLAVRVPEQIREMADRVITLLQVGWREVQVITDHGWLLLPNGLPKVDLPEHLTLARKGRCARLKPASATGQQTIPWHWDKGVTITVAPGISTYIAGKEYEHGGLSPQECVVPILSVTSAPLTIPTTNIADLRWTGMRCRITVTGASAGMTADLRSKAADSSTSMAASTRPLDSDGRVSLAVKDDSSEGHAAVVVIMDGDGNIVTQRTTVVGEES